MQNNSPSTFSRFFKSFGYAVKGIIQIAKAEPNFRFHVFAAIVVIIAGFYFGLTENEWLAVCFAIGFVFCAEALNTAIEKLVDLVSPQQNPLAGTVKDIAAGAVLLAAITAAIVGGIIFLPKILALFCCMPTE